MIFYYLPPQSETKEANDIQVIKLDLNWKYSDISIKFYYNSVSYKVI